MIEMGDPILRKQAEPVLDVFSLETKQIIEKMIATLAKEKGIGIAAPQVGDSRRILVSEPRYGDEDGDDVPLFIMINPEITHRSDDMIGCEEGCLSVPDFLFKVPRHKKINVKWRTPSGEAMSRSLSDFHAIVIQHEMDHLDGVTLLDRASRPHRRKWLQGQKKKRRKG